MDAFLADYYDTLGYSSGFEKTASYGGYTWEELEYLAMEKLGYQPEHIRAAQVKSRRQKILENQAAKKREAKRRSEPMWKDNRDFQQGKGAYEFDEADRIMRERQTARQGGAPKVERGPDVAAPKPTRVNNPTARGGKLVTDTPAEKPTHVKPKPGSMKEAPEGIMSRMKGRWGKMSRGGKAGVIGGTAAGLAALGGGAAYLHHRQKNKAASDSAFDHLIEKRAFEILAANGLADDYGNVIPPDAFEKTADDFDSIVDDAALELLEAHGYPVERY